MRRSSSLRRTMLRRCRPSCLRKGRFDEVWFVDLPTTTERDAVLSAALRQHGRGDVAVNAAEVAKATEGFTGSEIAAWCLMRCSQRSTTVSVRSTRKT